MDFLPVLRISLVSVIPPLLLTHFRLTATVIRRTSGRNLGAMKKAMIFMMSGSALRKSNSTFCTVVLCCLIWVNPEVDSREVVYLARNGGCGRFRGKQSTTVTLRVCITCVVKRASSEIASGVL